MPDATTPTVDATVAAISSKVTYTGAGASILGWLMSSQAGILIGIMLGIAGFVVNWYYRAKEDRRQQTEHDRRMGLYE